MAPDFDPQRPRTLALVIAFLINAGPLYAQPATDAGDKERQALVLYEQGIKHYNVAEYGQAIELFKQAYLLTEAPELLFNIAQSYRLKGTGSCRSALQFYRSYLRVAPVTAKRASVEAAIADMEVCARDEPPRPDEPLVRDAPAQPMRPSSAASASSDPSDGERAHQPLLPKILIGAGAAAAAVGGGTLIWVWRRYESIKASGCAPHCDPAIVDPPRTGQIVGDVLILAGVAAAATGGVLWLMYRRPTKQQAWIAPVGAGVTVGITF